MAYGLDFDDVRYETDHAGNRLKATCPYPMFSALVEFWIAARRAQTAKLEAGVSAGQYRSSLQAAQAQSPEHDEAPPAAKPVPFHRVDANWQKLLERMPVDAEPLDAAPVDAAPASGPVTTPPPAATAPESHQPTTPAKRQRPLPVEQSFFRDFIEAPPDDVMKRIAQGVHFLRAWREYRGLSQSEAAELCGCDPSNISLHERGIHAPKTSTLAKLADIYDAPVLQMTPKPSASATDATDATDAKARRMVSEPRSPADTFYPDVVLAHLVAGKTPLVAWRLYRRLSVGELADAYGGRVHNMISMEKNDWLRQATINKLCPILKCKPEQLLRPFGLEDQPALDAAPARASVIDLPMRERAAHDDKRHERIARMQRELTGF